MVASENPIKEGYIFTAWYEDEELTKVYSFEKMQAEDITLYTKKLKTAQLSVKGTSHSVLWSSSNVAVAKVSQKGKVTAVGKGTAYITATVDGVSYRCKIVVKKNENYLCTENQFCENVSG